MTISASAGPWILGLANNTHNGAACLIRGGRVMVAVQEERLSRIKRDKIHFDESFLCVRYCLEAAGIGPGDLSLVVECRSENVTDRAYHGSKLADKLASVPHVTVSHHLAHAFSCAGPSGFSDAVVLVADGGGSPVPSLPDEERELVSTEVRTDWCYEHLSVYLWQRGEITPVVKLASDMQYLATLRDYVSAGMPNFASLGHMFSSVALAVFGNYHDAGKVMGLAPYGEAAFGPEDWFGIDGERIHFHDRVPEQFRGHQHWPRARAASADLAASVQVALEAGLKAVMNWIDARGLPSRLAYAGGVALNSVANHNVLAPRVDELFILPAAEDSGTALGAALYGLHLLEPQLTPARWKSDALGRSTRPADIDRAAAQLPAVVACPVQDPLQEVLDRLLAGEIVGWLHGGSELGPRALGQRSILCDPRRLDAKDVLNARVKHREAFRPFAPVILSEHLGDWFEVRESTQPMESMLEVCKFRREVPALAVVHKDRTGRPQVLRPHAHPTLRRLLAMFHERTGVPMLINTSFNVMGEPLVETPLDALRAMLFTGIDAVYLQGRVFCKEPDYAGVRCLVPVPRCAWHREGEVLVLDCVTEHGQRTHRATDEVVGHVLAACNGRLSVGKIAERLAAAGVSEDRVIQGFGWLMRASAVGLLGYDPTLSVSPDHLK